VGEGGEYMNKMSYKVGAFITAGLLGLQIVTPVFAVGFPKVERKELVEEIREKAGSRPGLLRDFFTNKGRAAIGSGTISAITGTTLTVKAKDGKTYTVLTDDKTQFRRRFWGKGSLSEMSVGDMVNVIGKWTDDTHTVIQARLVRDLSIKKRNGVFFGTVQSVSSSGFVIQTRKRGTLTMTTSASTKFVNRKEETITKADVIVGHRIRVKGLWDSKLNTLTEVTQVKDFSLPVKPTPTSTP